MNVNLRYIIASTIGVLLLAELAWTSFLSFNPRAVSGEGKAAARCLSSSAQNGCTLSSWSSVKDLKGDSACAPCADDMKRRYAVRTATLPDGARVAIAIGVDVYEGMEGDAWLGVNGEAVHCEDFAYTPSPLRRPFAERPKLARDERCAVIRALPPPSRAQWASRAP